MLQNAEAQAVAHSGGASAADAHALFVHVQTPLFHSTAVHNNFVDSVAWFGDALCTKSVHNEAVLWAPQGCLEDTLELGCSLPGTFDVLRRLPARHAEIWFLKFDFNLAAGAVACGSTHGDVHAWALPGLKAQSGPIAAHSVISVSNEKCTVRSVALVDCRRIVAGTDDGRLIVMQHASASGKGK